MIMSPAGLTIRPENDCAGEAISICKRQTRPLIWEGTPHQPSRSCLRLIIIWSWVPDRYLTPRQTGRPIVGCNITLNSGSPAGNGVRKRGHILGIRYQAGKWIHRKYSVCRSEKSSGWIIESAVIACVYDIHVFSKSSYQYKPRAYSH
jgi:hypothetical protein